MDHAPERELPLLAAIGGFFRWLEELLAILAGPLLTAGLLIALIDLLTDGKLLATQPELLYGWAIAMGAGLDAQLIGASVKLGRAIRAGRVLVAAGYLLLVCGLAYVAFVAAQVFATQQADGLTTAAALSQLGMDKTSWLIQRSALSVFLVVLSGVLRYTPPAKRPVDASAAVAEIGAKQQIGLARIAQLRAYGDALRGQVPTAAPEPPTDGGTPLTHPPLPQAITPDEVVPPAGTAPGRMARRSTLRLVQPKRNRSTVRAAARRSQADLQAMAYAVLDRTPTMSLDALARTLSTAKRTAQSLRTGWQLDRGQQGAKVPRQARAR